MSDGDGGDSAVIGNNRKLRICCFSIVYVMMMFTWQDSYVALVDAWNLVCNPERANYWKAELVNNMTTVLKEEGLESSDDDEVR